MKERNPTQSNAGGSPPISTRKQSESSPAASNQTHTPQELHDRAKMAVSKGLAAAAGVLEGFSERMREDQLAEKASDSIHQAGDVTIKVTEATREEAGRIQSEMQHAKAQMGADGSSGSSGGSGEGQRPSQQRYHARERTPTGAGQEPVFSNKRRHQ